MPSTDPTTVFSGTGLANFSLGVHTVMSKKTATTSSSIYSQQINIDLNCMIKFLNHCILPDWSCERKHALQSLLRLTILTPHWLTQSHPCGLTQHWGSMKMLSTVHNDKRTFPKSLSFVAPQCQHSFITTNMLSLVSCM